MRNRPSSYVRPTTADLRPPRLCTCVCASQKSQSHRRAIYAQPGPARVSQGRVASGEWRTRSRGRHSPWCTIIALAGECAFRRSMHAVVCEPDLQRHYRDCSGDCPRCVGATPLQSRPRNHSGLTPAALVHVRLCIAKIAVPSASDLRASRSGGRKPAVRIRRHICNRVRRRNMGVLLPDSSGVFATAIPHIFADRHRAANQEPRARAKGE